LIIDWQPFDRRPAEGDVHCGQDKTNRPTIVAMAYRRHGKET
jgi:hypothetical protein